MTVRLCKYVYRVACISSMPKRSIKLLVYAVDCTGCCTVFWLGTVGVLVYEENGAPSIWHILRQMCACIRKQIDL